MVDESPQPGHVDAVGGEVIHEAKRKFIIVYRGCEVAVEDLEAIIRRHVERMLDALNGDIPFGYSVDRVPQFLREQLFRRLKFILLDDATRNDAVRSGCDSG